ncbi:cysteine hydrolase [Stutzerimonas stutzeri]|uniref:cysteine hydrolase n=1 Tax=Stutzerimonas stutzeri TaxID=316 RepID=UPI003012C14C
MGHRNNPNAEAVILALLAYWRERLRPVIHIKHRSSETDSVFWPLQEGFAFKNAFQPDETETVIEKIMPCAFTTVLESVLTQRTLPASSLPVPQQTTRWSNRTNYGLQRHRRIRDCRCLPRICQTGLQGRPRSATEAHYMSLANLDGEYAKVINLEKVTDQRGEITASAPRCSIAHAYSLLPADRRCGTLASFEGINPFTVEPAV